MTDLAKYVVALEVQTAQYMQALDKANAKLDSFHQDNKRSLDNLEGSFTKSFRHITREARELLALYGAFRVIHVFQSLVEGAEKANALTEEQKNNVESLTKAYGNLKNAAGRLIAESSRPLFIIPGVNDVSIFDRIAAGIDKVTGALHALNEASDKMSAEIFGNGFTTGGGFGRTIDDLQELTVKHMEAFPRFIPGGPVQNNGQELSPQLESFIDDLKEGQKVTADMATDVEKQVAEWHEAQRLFETGGISAETLSRVQDSLLQPIEVTAKRLHEAKEPMDDLERRAKQFADNFAASFSSRGIQAILDGDFHGALQGLARDFAELVLRIAILQPMAEKLAKTMNGFFNKDNAGSSDEGIFGSGSQGGGIFSIFSGLFGGSRASGGPVAGGMVYRVHPGEAFFTPDVSGSVGKAGRGGAVYVEQHNHFDVGLESVDQRIQQAAGPISQATTTAIMKALRRPAMA